jgi:hypothetical protein
MQGGAELSKRIPIFEEEVVAAHNLQRGILQGIIYS